MKYFFSILISLLLIDGLKAQQTAKSHIKGHVITSDGQPGAFVTVQIKNTKFGTITDENGDYQLRNVPAGKHVVVVSIIGFESAEINIETNDDRTMTAETIRLKEDAKTLQQVTITGNANKFGQKETGYVARLPLKNLENPQVYNVVSKELAVEQIAVDYKNLLRNVPGATVSFGGVNNGITYMVMRGSWVTSQIRNGMAAQLGAGIDPVNVERVEAIKGPSGTLFGSSLISFGGFTNLVTKKPFEKTSGEIGYSTGSWGMNRITLDVNSPVKEDKTLLLRVNAAGHRENSFQAFGMARAVTIAPSLSYQASEKLTLLFETEFYRTQRSTMPANSFTNVTFKNIKDMPLGYRQSINSNDPLLQMGTSNAYVQAQYKLSKNWTSTTQYAVGDVRYDNVNYFYPAIWTSDSTVVRNLSSGRNSFSTSTQFQQYFTGDFVIGSLRNRIVAGVDVYGLINKNQAYGTITYDTINVRKSIKPISLDRIDELVAGIGSVNITESKQQTLSAYFSEVLNITDKLMAMISVRVDRFSNKGTATNSGERLGGYDQTAISPKFGLVYQPVKDKVAIFANYMNGFQNIAPITQPDQSIFTPKPQSGNQWEFGTKLNSWNNRIVGSVSYYNIDITNVIRPNPTNTAFSVQDGSSVSKGIEADMTISPINGLNIVFGYGYNQLEYKKSTAANEGLKYGFPRHAANWWASYRLLSSPLKGLGIGTGGNYLTAIYENNELGALTIPSYTRWDMTLFYDQPRYRLGLKMNNLTNQKYWGMNFDPQSPRQILANVTFKF
ncbi:iron complex outermembrane recepter protein [Dyadobacter koreensis]|uniref:Iron complex outermembrane recepter protein n=1 Tax=Dyadobacter koreensis TaxID=408657 RepID=A0A1H6Q9E9_9BACT|nr:TonB-dependent receptor [Dyadobacter koreensis]SEI38476.1 iron complex outermembrane recepter protein [Dyadobacter koreensis]